MDEFEYEKIKKNDTIDFYDNTYLKASNLNSSIRYELELLNQLDLFTRKHSENVATITYNLCRKLHLSKGFTEYCVTCAYIHDLGKMFIPQEVLQKNGALTQEEFEIIKTHTTLGYNLCQTDKQLKPYSAGPYYHHEALDGSGYPQGLTKPDIPYEAQIIRVADEFDALVSKRQYKSHIDISDSLKIIIENTKPSPNAPQNTKYSKEGKDNKNIVKKLIKVVIDDTNYEISCLMDYMDYLKQEIKRFEKIDSLVKKRDSSKKDRDYQYYNEYIKLYLKKNEPIEKIYDIYNDFLNTYNEKDKNLKKLFNEIKIIKSLKV